MAGYCEIVFQKFLENCISKAREGKNTLKNELRETAPFESPSFEKSAVANCLVFIECEMRFPNFRIILLCYIHKDFLFVHLQAIDRTPPIVRSCAFVRTHR